MRAHFEALGRKVGVPGVGEPFGRYTPTSEQGEEVSLAGGDDAVDFVASDVVVPAVEALDDVFAVCQPESAEHLRSRARASSLCDQLR